MAHSLASDPVETHLPNAAFKIMRLPLPPLNEQAAIADFLARVTKALAAVAARAQREIDLLIECRTRLIVDVVTGKLDVREAAARLPSEVEVSEAPDETDVEDDAACVAGELGDEVPHEAEA